LQARGDLEQAEPNLRQSVDMFRRLTPPDKFPDGSLELATALDNLGQLLKVRGELVKAEPYCTEALAMYRRLYPADKFPDGQADLATCMDNLGALCEARGEYGRAAPLYRDALAMYRRLYPPDKYPNGQPDLIICLNHLARLLQQGGDFDEAERLYRDALVMRRKLHPTDKFPGGHADVAESLFELGRLLRIRGEYDQAEPFVRDSLAMYRRLQPSEKYPGGSPELSRGLNELGLLLEAKGDYGEAEPYYRDALAMDRRLYPADKYPDGHTSLATVLENQGSFLANRGEYSKAEPFYREALAMRRKLYPAEKYPVGHRDLANSLNKLGDFLDELGEYAKAEPFYREALAMRQKLYPADKYPDGHPELASTLSDLAFLLARRGEKVKADPLCREALDMYRRLFSSGTYFSGLRERERALTAMASLSRRLGEYDKAALYHGQALDMLREEYPADKFPDGHPRLAIGLVAQATSLECVGDNSQAERFHREALAMFRRLYPTDKFPDGREELATSLIDLGMLLVRQSKLAQAEPFISEALDMDRRLYPTDKFPDGREELAAALACRAVFHVARNENGKAADLLAESAAMYDRLAASFAESGAEAEALNFAATLPEYRHNLLYMHVFKAEGDPSECYAALWRGKAALASIMGHRTRLVRAVAAADQKTRGKLQEYMAVRQDLARLALAPNDAEAPDRTDALRQLTDRKERLEKELASALPPADHKALLFTELRDALPDRAAFVDLYRYQDWDSDANKWTHVHYAIFIIRKGRPARRVEIKDGDAVEKDMAGWREEIAKDFHSDAAARLRDALWLPIRNALADDTDTIYVCPDGELSALPWPALPAEREGRVLLEDYAFAVVPSGPFLLEQLTRPADRDRDAGTLLAVGGVRYDRAGAPAETAGRPWRDLPATDKERAAVLAEAARLPRPPAMVERSGADATVARLVADLPRARWAHLATHGFFAAPDTKERERLFRPGEFLLGAKGERLGAAARNPLTLSGVVLAGGNRPTDDDSGILTGEAVAGLDLEGMDLAVLSACETGLGEAARGEGVFGLQRAFHVAGAKNVVASLWRVDDEAAAALMNLFYYHLWEKKEPPLEALRHAQLEMYRNPEAVANLAKGSRSPDWDATFQAVTRPPADPQAPPRRPAAVKDWAAFVLSGAGR
jgi:CHAT domain-containing protein